MATKFGIRVDATGQGIRTDLSFWKPQAVSIVARYSMRSAQLEYLAFLSAFGLDVALVLDHDSIVTDCPPQWDTRMLLEAYRSEYGPFVTVWIVGNEQDHISPSSSTMSQADFMNLAELVRDVMGPNALLATGGFADGYPDWDNSIEPLIKSVFNIYNYHLYGQRPLANWPTPDWGFGFAEELIGRYQDRLNMEMMAGEYGSQASEVGEDFQAEYAYKTAEMHKRLGMVYSLMFCESDKMVPTFGARRDDDSKRPLFGKFQEICALGET